MRNTRFYNLDALAYKNASAISVNPIHSGGYWVRRMRQSPQAPLENST